MPLFGRQAAVVSLVGLALPASGDELNVGG
jgi:hypothetical protein